MIYPISLCKYVSVNKVSLKLYICVFIKNYLYLHFYTYISPNVVGFFSMLSTRYLLKRNKYHITIFILINERNVSFKVIKIVKFFIMVFPNPL